MGALMGQDDAALLRGAVAAIAGAPRGVSWDILLVRQADLLYCTRTLTVVCRITFRV